MRYVASATRKKDFSGIDSFLEDILYDVWDEYRYEDYSANDIVDMVWEHAVLIITEMDDDGIYEEYLPYAESEDRSFRAYVRRWAKDHYDDYEWDN